MPDNKKTGKKEDYNWCCSYCGKWHPDELFECPKMIHNKKYLKEKEEFEKKFPLIYTKSSMWNYISSLLDQQREELIEETIKMLWSIHENETDKEMEAWNRSLDLAIFKLKSHSLTKTK